MVLCKECTQPAEKVSAFRPKNDSKTQWVFGICQTCVEALVEVPEGYEVRVLPFPFPNWGVALKLEPRKPKKNFFRAAPAPTPTPLPTPEVIDITPPQAFKALVVPPPFLTAVDWLLDVTGKAHEKNSPELLFDALQELDLMLTGYRACGAAFDARQSMVKQLLKEGEGVYVNLSDGGSRLKFEVDYFGTPKVMFNVFLGGTSSEAVKGRWRTLNPQRTKSKQLR